MKTLHWIGTWSQGITDLAVVSEEIEHQTLRTVVQLSLGGGPLRVRLSNAYGHRAVQIGAAQVAFAGEGAAIITGTARHLLFEGRADATIPAGGEITSDPVDLNVPALTFLAVSLYFPQRTLLLSGSMSGSPRYQCLGNATDGTEHQFVGSGMGKTLPGITLPPTIPFLAGVDVVAASGSGAAVAFGDSITSAGWPAMLAERLHLAGNNALGVVNQGIAGNRILHDSTGLFGGGFGPAGLKRFAHDALDQPGVQYVLLLEGVNDLGHPGAVAPIEEEVSADQLIRGLQTFVEQAHIRGITILGGTILAFEGNPMWNPEREEKRQAVNAWIRGAGVFDGVFDAERATCDPARPASLHPAYDSGDHLHLNHDGLRAIAESVDLALLTRSGQT
jgi:lysophospholipase L1-like esterase